MSIRLDGTLHIKAITGRNGAFSVGELVTEIGTFKVKDTALDQYDAGAYPGQFVIAQIFPSSYIASGKVIIEVRATLSHMDIECEQPPRDEEPAEPDPINESANAAAATDSQHSVPAAESARTSHRAARAPKQALSAPPLSQADSTPAGEGAESDESLFGPEIHAAILAGQMVKLDPSVDRPLFRRQRDRMGRNGLRWIFDPISQSWTPPQ